MQQKLQTKNPRLKKYECLSSTLLIFHQNYFILSMTQLNIKEVQSQNDYNDFLEITDIPPVQNPQTSPLQNQSEINMQYQKCEYCFRNFFQGRLAYHLKLCTKEKPMLIRSPKKNQHINYHHNASQTRHVQINKDPKQQNPEIEIKLLVCQICGQKIPIRLIDHHKKNCTIITKSAQASPIKRQKNKKNPYFPRLNLNSISKQSERSSIQNKNNLIRSDLSCFVKAQQIKKIECQFCGRKFAKNAGLRHIPICEIIENTKKKDVKIKKKLESSKILAKIYEVVKQECKYCKHTILNEHRFCGFCGKKRD